MYMAETPIRSMRIPDEEWADWHERAEAAGVTVTAWVRAKCSDSPDFMVEAAERHRLATTLEPVEPLAVLDPAEFIKPTGAGIVPDETAGLGETIAVIKPPDICRHPKKFRDVKPYATFCSTELGGCGARL